MPHRKSNGEGHIRQRKDKLWEAQLFINGKRKSIYGKTKTEVRKKMTETQAQYDAGEYTEASSITLAEWADIWLTDYMMGKRDSTIAQYTMYVNKHILPTLGKVPLQKLTAPQIQHLYNALCKDMEPKTVKNIHGILHGMLEKAIKIGYLRYNPTAPCELPKIIRKEMHPILDDRLPRFLEAIKGHRYEKLFYVAVFTGMRESEIIGLTWNCVNFEHGTIRLYRQLLKVRGGHGAYEFGPLKTRQERLFKPAPQVMEVLKEVRRQQATWKLRCGEAWHNPSDLVFTHEDGSHLCSDSVYGCFKRVVTKIGMPEVRFHDLRHTFITLSVENGTDFKTISETVGHATVAFTQDRYGHVSNAMMDNAAERMERLISGLK